MLNKIKEYEEMSSNLTLQNLNLIKNNKEYILPYIPINILEKYWGLPLIKISNSNKNMVNSIYNNLRFKKFDYIQWRKNNHFNNLKMKPYKTTSLKINLKKININNVINDILTFFLKNDFNFYLYLKNIKINNQLILGGTAISYSFCLNFPLSKKSYIYIT